MIWDIGCLCRRNGVLATLRKVRQALRAEAELLVVAKGLDEIPDVALGERLRLEELDRAALPALAGFNRGRCDTRATRRFAAGLARGHRGFVAYRGAEVAGHYWWVDRRIDPRHPHLQRLGIELGQQDVYGFDFFISELHRGEGRAVAMLQDVETRLRQLGYERVWGYVLGDNRPARWLYSMRGYEVVGRVHLRPGQME
jgi:GNAT superfamily N-acetyltransferase